MKRASPSRIVVLLNGDGLSTRGLSGGAVRAYEVLRAWAADGKATVHAVTTSGGESKLRAAGLNWPVTLLKASLVGKRERLVLYRIISYLISAVHFQWKEREVPPVELVISSSDFFCDTAPARLLKKRRPSDRKSTRLNSSH